MHLPKIFALCLSAVIFCAPTIASAKSQPSSCADVHLDAPKPDNWDDSRFSSFLQSISGKTGPKRDQLIAREVVAGNVPKEVRILLPVLLSGKDTSGNEIEVTICVSSDYLSVGGDKDSLRVPVGLPAAKLISQSLNTILPSRKMVDAIYEQADVKLRPSPMEPGPKMTGTQYFVDHNRTIENQVRNHRTRKPQLIAGHKKDIVLTKRLDDRPEQIAIYGWHRLSGKPTQALSLRHGKNYADYSHGLRLISRLSFLNGDPVDIVELLSNPSVAHILTDEGSFDSDHPAIKP